MASVRKEFDRRDRGFAMIAEKWIGEYVNHREII